MRTVDPALWARTLRKAPLSSSFGQQGSGRRERQARRGLRDALLEWLRVTHTRSVRMATLHTDCQLETLARRWLALVCVVLGALTLGGLVHWQRSQPLAGVALPSLEHSIDVIEFPAVALCSYSILDKQRARDFARDLYKDIPNKHHRGIKKYTVDEIYENLLKFGALINFGLPSIDLEFTEFLKRQQGGGNVTYIMEKLATPCSESLVRCIWAGQRRPCEELFVLRSTQLGLCCTFNARYSTEDMHREPYRCNKTGQENGLVVFVKRDIDQQVYPRGNGLGTEVLLFEGSEYPLLEGGALRTFPALLNQTTYLVLSVQQQAAQDQLHHIAEDRLGCKMRKSSLPSSAESSHVWCLTHCRRNTILDLCGCVPFWLFPEKHEYICGLNQLSCLNKYKEKLLFYFPESYDPGLQEEWVDSIYCAECLPDCARTRYSAAVYVSKYLDRHRIFRSQMTTGLYALNASLVRIYFASEGQRLYTMEVTERWYELISVTGAYVSLLLGVTLLVYSELVYFLTFRFVTHFRRIRREMWP